MYSTPDEHFATLDRTISNQSDYELAKQFAPRILFDEHEPFFPSIVGYTVFHETADSPSFPRQIEVSGNITVAIEYAVWWDWDIQHLYELEHIWVYLSAEHDILRVDASWHGGWNQMVTESGGVPVQAGKVTLYSESGKHAFGATITPMLDRKPITDKSTSTNAGKGGVLVTPLFEGVIKDRTPINNRVVVSYLQQHRFEPTYNFTNSFELETIDFVPWETLNQWIPERVSWWVQHLHKTIPYNQRYIWRIAHRGASAYAQEGSTASIDKAVELGADVIEIDLRFTADTVPVIAHDSSLQRVFGVSGNISDMTLDEVKAATPDGYEPVLTFAEMVEVCKKNSLGLYLDIKELNMDGAQTIFNILDETHMFSHVVFASFRPDWVAEIKAHRADAITSILYSSLHVNAIELGRAVNADYVHPCFERFDRPQDYISGDWIEQVRNAGFGVICWHEERPEVIADLYDLGVDGICSDMPELLTQHAKRL